MFVHKRTDDCKYPSAMQVIFLFNIVETLVICLIVRLKRFLIAFWKLHPTQAQQSYKRSYIRIPEKSNKKIPLNSH